MPTAKTLQRFLRIAVYYNAVHKSQPRCPSIEEWIKNSTKTQWNIFSARKKGRVVSFSEKGTQLEIIILNILSQFQKDKYYVFSFVS